MPAAQNKIDAFSKSLSKSLDKLKKQDLTFELVLDNKTRYNPLPVTGLAIGGISPGRGFVTEFGVIGVAQITGYRSISIIQLTGLQMSQASLRG